MFSKHILLLEPEFQHIVCTQRKYTKKENFQENPAVFSARVEHI